MKTYYIKKIDGVKQDDSWGSPEGDEAKEELANKLYELSKIKEEIEAKIDDDHARDEIMEYMIKTSAELAASVRPKAHSYRVFPIMGKATERFGDYCSYLVELVSFNLFLVKLKQAAAEKRSRYDESDLQDDSEYIGEELYQLAELDLGAERFAEKLADDFHDKMRRQIEENGTYKE